MLLRPCRSTCECARRDKETIKLWSTSFPSHRRISLLVGLFKHTEQGAAAAAGVGWWRGPPEQTQSGTRQPRQPGPARFMSLHPSFPTQRPLSGASGCIGLYYFLPPLSTFSSSSFTVPHSLPIFFFLCPSIFSLPLFLDLVSLSLFLPLLCSQTSWPAVHPDRVSTAVCAKLSCISRGRLCSLQRKAPSRHLCLLSMQHLWPKHDLDTTILFSAKPSMHTAWR